MMLRSTRIQVLLFVCLGFILAQTGVACAMPRDPQSGHAAMGMPCDHDQPAPAAACPPICPLAHVTLQTLATADDEPLSIQRLEFPIAPSAGAGLSLSPETPPPRGAGAVELNL